MAAGGIGASSTQAIYGIMDTMRKVQDFLRAASAAILIVFVVPQGMESLIGQAPPPQAVGMSSESSGGITVPESQLIQWAVKEGGAFAVILIILFFYRRDWQTATNFWKDQHAITTDLVKENAKAGVEMAAALRENTQVVHSAKNVMQQYLPARREHD